MISTPRVYKLDESGERVYLDDEQREASVSRAQDYISENCG